MRKQFEITDISLNWRVKLHNTLAAHRDRKYLLKKFRSDLQLERLEAENLDFALPKNYLISGDELDYLYGIRGEIVVRFYREYVSAQYALDSEYIETSKELQSHKDRKAAKKSQLEKIKKALSTEKDYKNRVALEATISMIDSDIANTESIIDKCENDLKECQRIHKENIITWKKEIALIEKSIEVAISKYIKSATKKIQLDYGFNDFVHVIQDYDLEIKKTLTGDYKNE